MLVCKFGGTSVGSAERFEQAAQIILGLRDRQPVVVVSAMSGITNALIEGARAAERGEREIYMALWRRILDTHRQAADVLLGDCAACAETMGFIAQCLEDYEHLCNSIATLGELTLRGQDAVASLGERLSSRILAATLTQMGLPSRAVDATQLVRTDDRFGEATPDMATTRAMVRERLLPQIEAGICPVVTGYIGATAQGVVTTLGRGGSDFSGAIMGASLDAEEVWIWTDVDGILTADPNLVPNAQRLPELSFAEAEELAYFGATVLHPKTVAPLASAGIPLRIVNSFSPENPGTLISASPHEGRRLMPAIISSRELSLVRVAGNGGGWSLHTAARALDCLARSGTDVLMFSQSFSEQSLSMVVREADQPHCTRALLAEFDRELALGQLATVGTSEPIATLSVVGLSDAQGGMAARAFQAVGVSGLRIIAMAQAASSSSVSFAIAERDLASAVISLHEQLI